MISEALRVGLVGAGPWARMAHAPLLTGGSETELVGIWARRPEAAKALAGDFGTAAYSDYEQLLDACEAVAFAVPPGVQARMATRAAEAGKHLLLDKPIAADVAGAERLADAAGAAGVATLVLLTLHFTPAVLDFVRAARALAPIAVAYDNISGAFLDGPFSQSPWRHEGGVLPDVGPHVVDLFTSILGPVEHIGADTERGLTRLSLRHLDGGFSHAVLGAHHRGDPVHELRAYTPTSVVTCDWGVPDADRWGTVRRAFVETVRSGVPHACDVRRALELHRVLARVAR